MRGRCAKVAAFAAFAAGCAVCAARVFFGTWSLDTAPVMPDCPIAHPQDFLSRWIDSWLATGKAVPGDLRVFIGTPYFWQELQYAIALFLAASGAALFLRGRGLSRLASYGGGLLLAFSGYWCTLFSAGHLGWFRWMAYGVFAFALADRAARGATSFAVWLLLGATLAWGSFYQPDLWLLFTVFTAVWFAAVAAFSLRSAASRGEVSRYVRNAIPRALSALAVFVLVGLPSFRTAITEDLASREKQIASGETVGAAADDAQKRWIFATNWSMPPDETLEFVIPRLNGDTSCPNVLAIGSKKTGVRQYTGRLGRPYGADRGNYRQHSLYVGFITCLFALVGVVSCRRRRPVLLLAGSAVAFWLFSMGRYCEPVYRMVYALPMGDTLRAPVKWHHLTEFCIVMLAAFGIDAVERFLSRRLPGRRTGLFAAAALVAVGLADLVRIDSLYCAAIDLSPVRAANPAADAVKRLGGGKMLDLLDGGNGVVAWSFTTRDVDVTGDFSDPGVRFVWMPVSAMKHQSIARWIESRKAAPAGYYSLSRGGIRSVSTSKMGVEPSANMVLMQIPGVPASADTPQTPAPRRMFPVVAGSVSALVSAAVLFFAVSSLFRKFRASE